MNKSSDQLYFVCCKILGVEPGSDVDEIKAAYRKSAKELHPDINDSEKAHQYFVILQNAYEYLLDNPYSKEDIETYKKIIKDREQEISTNFGSSVKPKNTRKSFIERYTLREVLKRSLTARILYIVFHVLFLTVGIFLIIRSIFDIIFYDVDYRTNVVAAYFAIISAFVFGIVITSIFLYTGFNFLKRR